MQLPSHQEGTFFFFLEYGRCRTVARSLHEHRRSQKRHLYKDPNGPGVQANHNKPNKNTTPNHKTTRKSPSQICVSSKQKTANQTHKGARAQTKTPTKKDLPMDTAVLPLCRTQKHARINYPLRHSVKHKNRSIVYTVVSIEEHCTWSRAYEIASLSILSDVLVQKATMQRIWIVHPLLIRMSQWSLYQAPPQLGGQAVLAFRKICRPGVNHPYSHHKKQSAGPLAS